MRLCIQLLAAAVIISLNLSAQFETDYKPVTSKGNLPADFVTLSSKKYEQAKNQLSGTDKRTKKVKEKFLLQSRFSLDEILLSGKVLFNDPMGEYVSRVADNALASEPDVRKDLRFYIYKSTAVNAFSTDQGVVLVTTGLLAQLENEAQLAFIICHEAIHYKVKHAIKEYVEVENIKKGVGAYEQLKLEDRITAKYTFSKEQEKEADVKGLEIFLKSQYSTANLIGVYDVLKYSYLPFDDIYFDKKFLENSTLKIPDEYCKSHTQPIDTKDIDDDDSRSTHPSVKYRREKTEEMIKNANNTGKSDYLAGKQDFEKIREMARFELCRLYTLRERYESGIYTSYMMLKKYPNNLYLKKNVAWCLAGLAQYSNNGLFREVHYNSDSVEGKGQAVFYLMYKLDSARSGDLNVVALAYAAKLKNDYPNDPEVNEVYRNLMESLVKINKRIYSDFSTTAYVPVVAAKDTAPVTATKVNDEPPKDEESKSKYEKLREQKTEVAKTEPAEARFTRYAFVEFMGKEWFKNDFKEIEDEKESKKKTVSFDADNNRYGRSNYEWDKHVYSLGVSKIVVVDPEFERINAKTKEKYKYLESEDGQVDFAERLKLNGRKAKLEVDVINTKNLEETETAKLNEVAVMNDYINERLSLSKHIDLPYPERDRVKEIAEKYGTDYFMWTATISLTMKKHYTIYFALVYDVKNDDLELVTYREIRNRTRGYILNSHIYDVFNQIKSKPKKS